MPLPGGRGGQVDRQDGDPRGVAGAHELPGDLPHADLALEVPDEIQAARRHRRAF
jgi:hypothetical protein